jgi:hypothetical protein
MTAEWFAGRGRNAADEAVLAEIRRHVARTGLVDVRPEDTKGCAPKDQPLVLIVQVPGLQEVRGRPELQPGVDPEDRSAACLLGAWEIGGFVPDAGLEILRPASTGQLRASLPMPLSGFGNNSSGPSNGGVGHLARPNHMGVEVCGQRRAAEF